MELTLADPHNVEQPPFYYFHTFLHLPSHSSPELHQPFYSLTRVTFLHLQYRSRQCDKHLLSAFHLHQRDDETVVFWFHSVLMAWLHRLHQSYRCIKYDENKIIWAYDVIKIKIRQLTNPSCSRYTLLLHPFQWVHELLHHRWPCSIQFMILMLLRLPCCWLSSMRELLIVGELW